MSTASTDFKFTGAISKMNAEDEVKDAIREGLMVRMNAESVATLGRFSNAFCLGYLAEAVASAIHANCLERLKELVGGGA